MSRNPKPPSSPAVYRRFWVWFGGIFLAVGVVCFIMAGLLAVVMRTVNSPAAAVWPGVMALSIIGMTFAAIGGTFTLVGLRSVWRDRRLQQFGTTTQATVVSIGETGVRVNRRRLWRVRYTFDDLNGAQQRGTSGYLSPDEARSYEIGEQVYVRYDPTHPGTHSWVGREDTSTTF